METMTERKEKVAKIVKNIKKEYDSEINHLRDRFNVSSDMEDIVEFAQWVMCLDWVKKQIIDDNGFMLCMYQEMNLNTDEAIFWVTDIDIKMMIDLKDSWIRKLFISIMLDNRTIYPLINVNETNIGNIMFSALDQVIYKKNYPEED